MPRSYGTTNATPYATAPAIGPAGDCYFNTTTKTLYLSDGVSWLPQLVGGAAAGGDLTGTYPSPTIAHTFAAPAAAPPAVGPAGDTYWDTTQNVLFASNATQWSAVGPFKTFGAGVTIAGALPTIATATVTPIAWDTALYNRNASWSAANPTQVLLPAIGLYFVHTQVTFAFNATAGRALYLFNQAGVEVTAIRASGAGSPNSTISQALTFVYSCTALPDYLEVRCWQSTGAGLALDPGPRPYFFTWRLPGS